MTGPALPTPPAPSFLSPAARAGLEIPIDRTRTYPRPEDTDGWVRTVDRENALIVEMMGGLYPDVPSELRDVGGVPTYVITPDGAPEGDAAPVYLSIHGGGLYVGGGEACLAMSIANALNTQVVNWAPDYRMPPLHPFPAALDDLLVVYRRLLEQRPPEKIVLGGGSAGGNLAAALLLRAKEEGLPMPGGLVLVSPEIDLTESGDSFVTLAHASVGLQSLRAVNELYAAGRSLEDPYLSPLFGDLSGFPSTLLIGGTREVFLSNTVRMHRKLREAGVDADLHIFDGRPHVGFLGAPEEQAVDAECRRFVNRVLGLDR